LASRIYISFQPSVQFGLEKEPAIQTEVRGNLAFACVAFDCLVTYSEQGSDIPARQWLARHFG
jgi:hypothetical protein